jgi:hypothetical protein
VTTGIYVLDVPSGSVRPEFFEHQRYEEVINIKMHIAFLIHPIILMVFEMHRCEQSVRYACKTYHTAYTNVSLRMNPRYSKHVGDNRK